MLPRGSHPTARAASRAGVQLGLVAMAALLAACDRVPLTAPTESTITLFASGASVPLNGSVDIVASVVEKGGTPVQNGTVVSFTTTLGRIEPAEARTSNGRATVRLVADGRSGTASVTAFSGGAASEKLDVPVGAAAAETVVVRAEPGVANGSNPVQIIASVRDAAGNPIAGVPVTFTASAGQLGAGTVVTDANGEARTTLVTSKETEIRAQAGGKEGTLTLQYSAGPSLTVTTTPAAPVAGQAVTIRIEPGTSDDGSAIQSATIDFGDGRSQSLGRITGSTSVAHVYESSGTYTITVRARDGSGAETTSVTVIVVADAPAIAVVLTASGTPAGTGTVGSPMTFTAAATATGTSIRSYEWDFGDGSPVATTTGPSTSHIYASPGRRTVTVRVTGADGSTGEGRVEVTIS